MNTAETINLAIKLLILFFLAATSQVAFHKRIWWAGIMCLLFWANTFRLAILRAAMLYIGVFQKETPSLVLKASDILRSGNAANVTDGLVLVGSIAVFVVIATSKDLHKPEK